jgi:hypothetical protein
MRVGLGCCSLLALGLVSCGGNTGTVTLTGNDPAAMRTAPAGVATLVFMDLEALRPDILASASSLPNGITLSGGTYTFNGATAANAGAMTGTIAVAVAGGTYTETFDLTVTSVLAATATTPATTQRWSYQGIQVVTVSGDRAQVRVTPTFTTAFTDSATPANDKSYAFTASLDESWTSNPVRATLTGTYAFSRTGETISGAIAADPLVWTPATCDFPSSGTLALTLVSTATGTDATTVSFDAGCGQVNIGGGTLALGGGH